MNLFLFPETYLQLLQEQIAESKDFWNINILLFYCSFYSLFAMQANGNQVRSRVGRSSLPAMSCSSLLPERWIMLELLPESWVVFETISRGISHVRAHCQRGGPCSTSLPER